MNVLQRCGIQIFYNLNQGVAIEVGRWKDWDPGKPSSLKTEFLEDRFRKVNVLEEYSSNIRAY